MSLSRIKRRLKSGNHGSDSSEQSAASGVQGTFSTAPRQSSKAFVPPVVVPVKPITKIKDVLKDPELETISVQTEDNEQSVETPEEQIVVPQQSDDSEASEISTDSDTLNTPLETDAPQTISPSGEKFEQAWNTMFELLFREIATIYYPLKGVIPSIKNNIIQVKVKNEMMKDNFESRVRLALEYLRNNFDQRIDDIQVEVETNPAQTSKLIYDTQDKMNDLNKENPDLPEFLKILNLSAKDM